MRDPTFLRSYLFGNVFHQLRKKAGKTPKLGPGSQKSFSKRLADNKEDLKNQIFDLAKRNGWHFMSKKPRRTIDFAHSDFQQHNQEIIRELKSGCHRENQIDRGLSYAVRIPRHELRHYSIKAKQGYLKEENQRLDKPPNPRWSNWAGFMEKFLTNWKSEAKTAWNVTWIGRYVADREKKNRLANIKKLHSIYSIWNFEKVSKPRLFQVWGTQLKTPTFCQSEQKAAFRGRNGKWMKPGKPIT